MRTESPTPFFLTRLMMLCFFAIVSTYDASGQYMGYTPVRDFAAFREEFAKGSALISSVSSDFKQEKTLTALSESIVSSGDFTFKRDDKVRIEYNTPFYYLLVMNGDLILVKDGEKENEVNVRSNKIFRQIQGIMMECIRGTILDSKDFSARVFENKVDYLLEMTAQSKNLKPFFATIVVVVEKKDYSVKSIEMNEPSGDKTVMTFSNKRINASVSDAVFAF